MDQPAPPLPALPRTCRPVLVVMIDHHLGNTILSMPVIDALVRYFEHPVDLMVDARYLDLVGLLPSVRERARVRAYPAQAQKRRGIRRNLEPVGVALAVLAGRYRAIVNMCDGSRAWGLVLASLARERIGFRDACRPWIYTRTAPRRFDMHWSERYAGLLAAVGAGEPSAWPTLAAPEAAHRALDAALDVVRPEGDGPLAVIHPGAGKPGRRWPPERFARVADDLVRRHGARVCIIGTPAERVLADELRSAMACSAAACFLSLPLLPLLALFERSFLLVSNESGPTHLASTTGVPIVTIFGPSYEHEWRPARRRNLIVLRGSPCTNDCHRKPCAPLPPCLDRTAPATVLAAVDAVLDAARRREA